MSATPESSLLLTLDEISQLISHSHHPQQTLANIVRLLQRRFDTEVCSVYLLEPRSRELVLAETVGLQPQAVGRIRMKVGEGLTGLVAEEGRPVMAKEAPSHPRFKYFPEAGEDPFHSFLGVPLWDAGEVTGVLILQTVRPREFSADEVRMLNTVAVQLLPVVGEAWLLKQVEGGGEAFPASRGAAPRTLTGTSLSAGVGLGAAWWARRLDRGLLARAGSGREAEQRRLADAMQLASQETDRLSQRVAALVGEDQGAILQAQQLILHDRRIEEDLDGFLTQGASAEAAVLGCVDRYTQAFEKLDSPLFRERLYDIKDVFRRILWHLQPAGAGPAPDDQRLVLVGEEASVADLFAIDLDRLAGVVVRQGGRTCHAAILARSLRVPMVSHVDHLPGTVQAGQRLLVDGEKGVVHIEPSAELLAAYHPPAAPPAKAPADVTRPPHAPPATDSRAGVRIEANVNLLGEVHTALEQGAVAVGLYRTEFLILSRRTLISEEQQVRNYAQLLRTLAGRPASIRTFDLRADKAPPPSAEHPDPSSLDWRLVLRSPSVQRVFKQQVRAILRAGVEGQARLLVPLVVSSEQLAWVKKTLAEAREELRAERLPFAAEVPLGIMIEVPAAALLVDQWAPQVDFLCIGTNDLLASAMGVSRDDPVGDVICDPLHPGLVQTVRHVITAAHAAGKPVTICGELAATAEGVPLLAEMGADALSVPVDRIRQVRAFLA